MSGFEDLTIYVNGWVFTWEGGRNVRAFHPDVNGDVYLLAGPWDSTRCLSLATRASIDAAIDAFMADAAPVYLSIPRAA